MKHGFSESEKGRRIDNIPNTGTLTGNWETDHYGCWWEILLDKPKLGHMTSWAIGDYPENYFKDEE